MKELALDGRLASVAGFVRQGARFADVGTDHAFLPLALLREGKIQSAVLSDINSGPLDSARYNVNEAGFSDRVKFVLTDGAAALSDEGLTDIAIAGMGGELIADIIGRAPFLKNGEIRLILQPMSRPGHLRNFLAESGFTVIAEDYSTAQGKYYVTMCAQYSGIKYTPCDFEREFGKREFITPLTEISRQYLFLRLKSLRKSAEGKIAGGIDSPEDLRLYTILKDFLNSTGEGI